METWNQVLREGWIAGSLASLLSTVVLALEGRRHARSASAPVNAVSHWYYDDEGLRQDRPSVRHTLPGYLTHHGAAVFWATAHAAARRHAAPSRPERPPVQQRPPAPSAATAAATAALAALVDLRLTPRRLTPGFEHRLPASSLVAVYAAFGLGLLLGACIALPKETANAGIPAHKPQLPIAL